MLIIPGSLNDAHYIDAHFYNEYTDLHQIEPEQSLQQVLLKVNNEDYVYIIKDNLDYC